MTGRLEAELAPAIGKQVRVFVLTRADLQRAAAGNPFDPASHDKEIRCHLMFLSAEPSAPRRNALMALQGEEYRFRIRDSVLYYAYPRKFEGRRRTIDFEKVLGVAGTSRTWKVVDKLIGLLDGG